MQDEKIRLCVDHPLGPGQGVPLTEAQAHYLFGVMRLAVGDRLRLFNGRDGEWRAEVEAAGRRSGALRVTGQTRPQAQGADLWLMFAPLKKARTDMLVEKAVELGATRLMPILTEYANAERFRPDKAEAHVREAAEQCETTLLPQVDAPRPLTRVLADWPEGRRLIWADEGAGRAGERLAPLPEGPAAILIGPEGGFSPPERARLAALPYVTPIALGPRILRAETAAIAMLTLWQAQRGDWV